MKNRKTLEKDRWKVFFPESSSIYVWIRAWLLTERGSRLEKKKKKQRLKQIPVPEKNKIRIAERRGRLIGRTESCRTKTNVREGCLGGSGLSTRVALTLSLSPSPLSSSSSLWLHWILNLMTEKTRWLFYYRPPLTAVLTFSSWRINCLYIYYYKIWKRVNIIFNLQL